MAVREEALRAEERIYVAPNWKLVWWRFRKHRLALISSILLIPVGLIFLFPEFFSTQDPQQTDARLSFIPPQIVRPLDGWRFRPYVYVIKGKRNPTTLRMEWHLDKTAKVPVRFFVRGHSYKLLGIYKTNIHLLGARSGENQSAIYLLGTDRLGRDMWSRLMYGTKVSLSVGLLGVVLSLFLGVLLGGISGYFGGVPDLVIQRFIEILRSLPAIPMWLALTAALPREWSPLQVYFVIVTLLSTVGWTTLGREVRGRFLALREEDFVMAAKLSGAGQMRVIFRHMLPAFSSHIIATSTLAVPLMVISETALSFLGVGLRPPVISWGVLLQEAQNLQTVALASWLLIPGIAVVFTVLTFNFIGDGLRDAADPYSR